MSVRGPDWLTEWERRAREHMRKKSPEWQTLCVELEKSPDEVTHTYSTTLFFAGWLCMSESLKPVPKKVKPLRGTDRS